MDKHYEKAKEAMRSNLKLWGYYDTNKASTGTIYGEPLYKFLDSKEDTELLLVYMQYMLQQQINRKIW
jgi:hypothetical protein